MISQLLIFYRSYPLVSIMASVMWSGICERECVGLYCVVFSIECADFSIVWTLSINFKRYWQILYGEIASHNGDWRQPFATSHRVCRQLQRVTCQTNWPFLLTSVNHRPTKRSCVCADVSWTGLTQTTMKRNSWQLDNSSVATREHGAHDPPPTAVRPGHGNCRNPRRKNWRWGGLRRGVVVSGVRRWTKLTHVGPG